MRQPSTNCFKSLVRLRSSVCSFSHAYHLDSDRGHSRSAAAIGSNEPSSGDWWACFDRSSYRAPLTKLAEAKHRGFAFVTYSSAADAQDAIDNMDLNEFRGKVLKVNTARPIKASMQPGAGNRASTFNLDGSDYQCRFYCFNSMGVRGLATTICKTAGSEWRSATYICPVVIIQFISLPGVQGRNAQRKAQADGATTPVEESADAEDEEGMKE